VAYELLLFAQRRRLHQAVAEWYEQTQADRLASHYPLLAHHWARAGVAARAIGYLDLGGEQALQTGAYQEAVRMFEEVLALVNPYRPGGPEPLTSPARAGRADSGALARARRERLLGEAYLGLGDVAASGEHLRTALGELGRPLAATRTRIAANMSRHIGSQMLHRAWPAGVLGRSDEARESLLESARTCALLNQIYYHGNRPVAAFGTAVKGLNLAERAGPSPELARLSASVGLSAGILPLHGVARAYIRRAFEAGDQVGDLPALALVLRLGGVYAIGIGQWDAARRRLDRAEAVATKLGDRRALAEIGALLAWLAYFRGDLATAAGRFADLELESRRTADREARAWGLLGGASVALRTGDLARAGDLLAHGHAPALTALLHLRRDGPEAAAGPLAAAMPHIAARPTKCYSFDLYACTAEVAVALREAARDPGRPGSGAVAGQACRALRRYARIFPIGAPRALLFEGRRRRLDGLPASARALWRRSLAAAQRLDMPYDEARAHAEIGRDAAGAERTSHLDRAAELFTAAGAAWDLVEVERLRSA
jgi:tetratricopeptide (TPR) repeat protein